MKGMFLFTYCLLISFIINAQLMIAPNTPVNGGAEAIITSGMSVDNTSALVSLPILQLGNNATVTTSFDLEITSGLRLYSGVISFNGDGRVLYSGNAGNLKYDEENYLVSGFYARGTGTRTYPIGTTTELADIKLDIAGTDPDVITSAEVFAEDPALPAQAVPSGIDPVSSDWYWRMTADGEFSSVIPALSINPSDDMLADNSGESTTLVVLEMNESKDAVNNLGRGSASNGEYVVASQGGTGPHFLLGVTRDVQLVINQIITPDNDGVNDHLEIQNLDLYAGSYEVILVDRLGDIVWSSRNLDGSVDFSFLEPGDYICVVNFAGTTARQMVTVLK